MAKHDVEEGKASPAEDPDCGEDVPLLTKVKSRLEHVTTTLQDLRNKKLAKKYQDDVQVALRGAFWVSMIALPLVLQEETIPGLTYLVDNGIYNSTVVVMFVYTIQKSVGQTIQLAWQGAVGTFFASFAIWLMFGFFPGGVTDASAPHVFWIGAGCGVAFTFFMLWLNVSLLAQVFALNWFAGHFMAFMHPDKDSSAYSQNFTFHTKGTAASSTVVSVAGFMFAVLAVVLPYPILAIWKAQEIATNLTKETCAIWEQSAMFYCGSSGGQYPRDMLAYHLHRVQDQQIGMLHGHIENAWWECLGFGKWQRTRMALKKYEAVLIENHDRLCCIMGSLLHETFDEGHIELMEPVKPYVQDVMTESGHLYHIVTAAAISGGIKSALEEETMKDSIMKTRSAITELTHAFQRTKMEKGAADIDVDQFGEHSFCFNICAYGRLACEFADGLVANDQVAHDLRLRWSSAVAELCDPQVLFDAQHLNFVARCGIMLCICWLLGYYGYPERGIKPADANMAETAAVLMSRLGGSVVAKNLDRLQGLVLGTIFGQTVYALFGWCEWWGHCLIITSIFVWTSATLYMYFSSDRWATVGCLLAAFGSSNFIKPCRTLGQQDPTGAYRSVMDCVVAIFIIIIVDTALSGERPTVKAYEAYVEFWECLRTRVDDLLDPNVKGTSSDTKQVMLPMIEWCATMNAQAIEEPRFWRVPWKKNTYADGVACAKKLRLALSGMEYAIADHPGEPKGPVCQAVQVLPSFGKIRTCVRSQMDQVESLIGIFSDTKFHDMDEVVEADSMQCWLDEVNAAVKELVGEAIASKSFPSGCEYDTLEDDSTCEVSLLVACIIHLMEMLDDLQHALLRAA